MALFNFRKEKKEKSNLKAEEKPQIDKVAKKVKIRIEIDAEISPLDEADVILRPHITEKASLVGAENKYVFDVTADANKKNIARDIKKIYKVEPIAVNILGKKSKSVFMKGKLGKKKIEKKAYISLKSGDKIEFV